MILMVKSYNCLNHYIDCLQVCTLIVQTIVGRLHDVVLDRWKIATWYGNFNLWYIRHHHCIRQQSCTWYQRCTRHRQAGSPQHTYWSLTAGCPHQQATDILRWGPAFAQMYAARAAFAAVIAQQAGNSANIHYQHSHRNNWPDQMQIILRKLRIFVEKLSGQIRFQIL